MSIEVTNVSKNFNAFKALNEINLSIQSGELVALLEFDTETSEWQPRKVFNS